MTGVTTGYRQGQNQCFTKCLQITSETQVGYAPEAAAKRAGKVRLLSLADLDGRTRAAQLARETRDRVCEDLGGADRLSTLQAIMADNVAVSAAMLTDMKIRWLKGEDIDVG